MVKQADSWVYESPRVRLGTGFTQQYQILKQENKTAFDMEEQTSYILFNQAL